MYSVTVILNFYFIIQKTQQKEWTESYGTPVLRTAKWPLSSDMSSVLFLVFQYLDLVEHQQFLPLC